MCCCFSSKVQGSAAGRCWLSLFIVLFIFSIILVGILAGLQTAIGGPISTEMYEQGSRILYAEFVINIIVSIFAIFIIVKVVRNWILGLVGLLGLALTLILTIVYVIFFAHAPGPESTSAYITAYYKENHKPPPFADFLQEKINTFLEENGCCGGSSLFNYKMDGNNDTIDVPDSCCKHGKRDQDCGKNLNYTLHQIDLEIADEALMDDELKTLNDYTKIFNKVLDRKIAMASEEPTGNMETKYIEFQMKRDSSVTSYTVGCGRFLEDVLGGKYKFGNPYLDDYLESVFKGLIGFAITKLLLNITVIAIYICYYLRFNFKSQEPSGQNNGIYDGFANLSEGMGNPTQDTLTNTVVGSEDLIPKDGEKVKTPSPTSSPPPEKIGDPEGAV